MRPVPAARKNADCARRSFSHPAPLPKLAQMTEQDPSDPQGRGPMQQLTIQQTATGYWAVQRGGEQIAFAMTRAAAERERETLERLSRCSERRSRRPQPTAA